MKGTKQINKHIFVWVAAFLLGGLGVDRFIRGQILLGILKLLTGGVFGIMSLVDFVIAIIKAYGDAFGEDAEIFFIDGRYGK